MIVKLGFTDKIVLGLAASFFLSLQPLSGASSNALVPSFSPVKLVDDRGVEFTRLKPSTRVVSLAPHLTEIAFAAGAGAEMVGVSQFSDYPVEATHLPHIGDGTRVDIERILQLKPDLVLAWDSGNQKADIARLEAAGIAVWVSKSSHLNDISRNLRLVGLLTGHPDRAEKAALEFEQQIDAIRQSVHIRRAGRPPVRIFYEIWHQPLLTVNASHLISEVMDLCGGQNVLGHLSALTPGVSLESVLMARPQVILGSGAGLGRADFERSWHPSPVSAIDTLPVYYIDPDTIERPSPRVIQGIKAICQALAHFDAKNSTRAP